MPLLGAEVGAGRSLIGSGVGHVLNGGGVGWVAETMASGHQWVGPVGCPAPVHSDRWFPLVPVGPRWSPLVARWVQVAARHHCRLQLAVDARTERIYSSRSSLFTFLPPPTPYTSLHQVPPVLPQLIISLIFFCRRDFFCFNVWKRVRSRHHAALVSSEEKQLQPLSAQEATADLLPAGE